MASGLVWIYIYIKLIQGERTLMLFHLVCVRITRNIYSFGKCHRQIIKRWHHCAVGRLNRIDSDGIENRSVVAVRNIYIIAKSAIIFDYIEKILAIRCKYSTYVM